MHEMWARVESRAKAKAELTMSYSTGDAERVWDFGMVDTDCVAFPVCESTRKLFWESWHASRGGFLLARAELERIGVYSEESTISPFLSSGPFPFSRRLPRVWTEGSETIIEWPATFSTRTGHVESVQGNRIAIRRSSDRHAPDSVRSGRAKPFSSLPVTPFRNIR